MKTATKTPVRILLLAIAAFGATAVAAQPPGSDVRRVEVRYDDLGVDRVAGAATLYRRIRAAAHDVCKDYAGRGAQLSARFEQCVDEAIARAVDEVDRPALDAHYARRHGKYAPIEVASK